MNDPVIDRIAQLPNATVAANRARHTQDRCHRILERRLPRGKPAPPRAWQAWSRALAVLGTMYFAEALRETLRAYGRR